MTDEEILEVIKETLVTGGFKHTGRKSLEIVALTDGLDKPSMVSIEVEWKVKPL